MIFSAANVAVEPLTEENTAARRAMATNELVLVAALVSAETRRAFTENAEVLVAALVNAAARLTAAVSVLVLVAVLDSTASCTPVATARTYSAR